MNAYTDFGLQKLLNKKKKNKRIGNIMPMSVNLLDENYISQRLITHY